mmetsp:Transcript_49620/g.106286  ORF Transcript_49620/g.106286 Transcript_49620/m.106286 type:complete len:208 (+) Transcript_49620:832-1455(+)
MRAFAKRHKATTPSTHCLTICPVFLHGAITPSTSRNTMRMGSLLQGKDPATAALVRALVCGIAPACRTRSDNCVRNFTGGFKVVCGEFDFWARRADLILSARAEGAVMYAPCWSLLSAAMLTARVREYDSCETVRFRETPGANTSLKKSWLKASTAVRRSCASITKSRLRRSIASVDMSPIVLESLSIASVKRSPEKKSASIESAPL